MNSICPMNFLRSTDTTDTTDTTIWKPGFMETSRTNARYKRNDRYNLLYEIEFYLSYEFFSFDRHDRYNDMETRLNCLSIHRGIERVPFYKNTNLQESAFLQGVRKKERNLIKVSRRSSVGALIGYTVH